VIKDEFKVSFLIVGAQKAGTSALASFLSQHPEVCFAKNKEVHLFDRPDFNDSWAANEVGQAYREYFPDFKGQNIVGEATPIYMFLPFIPKRIYRYNPKMKLIFLMRNPVERAISQYDMEKKRGFEHLPFSVAIFLEKIRLWQNRNNLSRKSSLRHHSYVSRGFYFQQIMRFMEYFPKEQMLFVKSEDLTSRHDDTLKLIYEFLGVNNKNIIPSAKRILESTKKTRISKRMFGSLMRRFNPDLIKLERILNVDFSDWRILQDFPEQQT